MSLIIGHSDFSGDGALTPSLYLTVDDDTLTHGQEVTVTAAAYGFTPTSYTFSYLVDWTNSRYAAVTQAGNELTFNAIGYGSTYVHVTATDGILSAGASIELTLAQMSNVTDFLTATSIADATIVGAVRTLNLTLKDIGVFPLLYDLLLFVGGTATTHKYNVLDPRDTDAAYRAVQSGGWTNNASGVTGNGTNTSIDMKIAGNVPGQNDISFGFYTSTNGSTGFDMSASASARQHLSANYSSTTYFDINNSANSASTTPPSDVRGFWAVNRIGATYAEVFFNGKCWRQMALASSAAGSTNFTLGNWSAGSIPTNRCYSLAFVGKGMTARQHADFYAAVYTFQSTLSRA
jgi:hypothetical protein